MNLNINLVFSKSMNLNLFFLVNEFEFEIGCLVHESEFEFRN